MLEFKNENNSLICMFKGRIDTEAAMKIEDELLDKVQHANMPVTFDFKDLEYVASSFLRTCVKTARIVGKEKLTVINSTREILHILEMTGFDKLMNIKKD